MSCLCWGEQYYVISVVGYKIFPKLKVKIIINGIIIIANVSHMIYLITSTKRNKRKSILPRSLRSIVA